MAIKWTCTDEQQQLNVDRKNAEYRRIRQLVFGQYRQRLLPDHVVPEVRDHLTARKTKYS